MGIDLKDITELIPFIIDNLAKCIYILVVCLIVGFSVGRLSYKVKIKEIMEKLTKKEEELEALKEENKGLKETLDKCSEKCNILQNQMTLMRKDGDSNSSFSTLNELGRIINSNAGKMEITALIELSLKRDKEVN